MTQEERESIITQLAFVEGVNVSVYENYTDDQLRERMEHLYGEETR